MAGEIDIKTLQITDLATLQERKRLAGGGTEPLPTQTSAHNIVTVEMPKEQIIRQYSPGGLKDERGVKYSKAMRGASSLDEQKNSRFRLNELTRGPLSVEAEEEARIESEVERRLADRLEATREKARAEAYEAGFAEGKGNARAEVLAELKPVVDRFDGVVNSFENMRHEIFKANEEFLIRMVYSLAKHVLLRELKEDTGYTKRLITQLLERQGTRENIKIYLGNEEYSSAEALKGSLAQALGQLNNITVELDPSIASRGCRVETEFGDIDAQIDVQIQNIAQALGVGAPQA